MPNDIPLWYPDLVPNQQWLINSVLYEDGLAAILPSGGAGQSGGQGFIDAARPLERRLDDTEWDKLEEVLKDLETLKREGLFHPVSLGDTIQSRKDDMGSLIDDLRVGGHPTLEEYEWNSPRGLEIQRRYQDRLSAYEQWERERPEREKKRSDELTGVDPVDYARRVREYAEWEDVRDAEWKSFEEKSEALKDRINASRSSGEDRNALMQQLAELRSDFRSIKQRVLSSRPSNQGLPLAEVEPKRPSPPHRPKGEMSPILAGKLGASTADELVNEGFLKKVTHELLEGPPQTVDAIIEWLAQWAARDNPQFIPTRLGGPSDALPTTAPRQNGTDVSAIYAVLPTLNGAPLERVLDFRKKHDRDFREFKQMLSQVEDDPTDVAKVAWDIAKLRQEIEKQCERGFPGRVMWQTRILLWQTGVVTALATEALVNATDISTTNSAALGVGLAVGAVAARPWTWPTRKQLRYVREVERFSQGLGLART